MSAPETGEMKTDEFPVDFFLLHLDDYVDFNEKNPDGLKFEDSMTIPTDGDFHFGEAPLLLNLDGAPPPPLSTGSAASIETLESPLQSGPSSPRASFSRSPVGSLSEKSEKIKIPRHKRESHINAEHRRRSKIQRGFEEVTRLVPAIAEVSTAGSKDSKAGMLSKTVDFCRQLRTENKELQKEADVLRKEIQALTAEINIYQDQLPPSGVEVPQPSNASNVESMFKDYLRARIFQNWKFWIFGMVIRPLFDSFNRSVVTTSTKDFCQSIMTWLERHCSLISLRPVIFNTLRHLSTKTSIMSEPDRLHEEAIQAAMSDSLLSDIKTDEAANS